MYIFIYPKGMVKCGTENSTCYSFILYHDLFEQFSVSKFNLYLLIFYSVIMLIDHKMHNYKHDQSV